MRLNQMLKLFSVRGIDALQSIMLGWSDRSRAVDTAVSPPSTTIEIANAA
jgi:hypothetical protein